TAVSTVTSLSADTGVSSSDFITSTASQTVSGTYAGTLGVVEVIQVSADGGGTWVTASASGGTWSASGVTLDPGTGTLSTQTLDLAGNTTGGRGHFYALANTSVVEVNAAWSTHSTSPSEGGNFYFDYNAFATIQDGVAGVSGGGTD